MTTTMTAEARDALAQATAEHIAAMPTLAPGDDITIIGGPAPTDIATIKATLLDGHWWISWMDEVVTDAMRRLHDAPEEKPLMCEGECGTQLPTGRIGFCDDCLTAASNVF